MNLPTVIVDAAAHCTPIETHTLEHFLEELIDEELEDLAHMPGTPAQVLASQFTYYAKSSTVLSETFIREKAEFSRLMDMVLRLPTSGKHKPKPPN